MNINNKKEIETYNEMTQRLNRRSLYLITIAMIMPTIPLIILYVYG